MLRESVKRGFGTSCCMLLRFRNKFPNATNHTANPGIQKQLDAFHEVEKDMKVEDLDLENMESDFMNIHNLYDQHEKEAKSWKEKQRLKIVERKYFKNHLPNMLTWAEKEQIRYLHNLSSEEWCIERLSQCFPATEEIIKKIIKSKWQPENADKILKHDSVVQHNWEKLKDGTLEVDPALRNHLMKFTLRSRNKMEDATEWMKTVSIKHNPRKPKKYVFAQIIDSYNQLKQKHTEGINQEAAEKLTSGAEMENTEFDLPQKFIGKKAPYGDSFFVKGVRSTTRQQLVTLEKYKEDILTSSKESVNDQSLQKLMTTIQMKNDNYTLEKEDLNEQTVHKEPTSLKMQEDVFASRIVIPKEKRKKGGTYKVSDCYYDNDGVFLYRVPGMKK